jgi:hypothetical protein
VARMHVSRRLSPVHFNARKVVLESSVECMPEAVVTAVWGFVDDGGVVVTAQSLPSGVARLQSSGRTPRESSMAMLVDQQHSRCRALGSQRSGGIALPACWSTCEDSPSGVASSAWPRGSAWASEALVVTLRPLQTQETVTVKSLTR